MLAIFHDRRKAGRVLGSELVRQFVRSEPNRLVLALPPGGVPVGVQVARALAAPLDVFVTTPVVLRGGSGPVQVGTATSGGGVVLDDEAVRGTGASDDDRHAALDAAHREVERLEHVYRGERAPVDVRGRTVVLVADGLQTGGPMPHAAAALRQHGAGRVVVAAPVASFQASDDARAAADECVCLRVMEPFFGVSFWYEDFPDVAADRVRQFLAASDHRAAAAHCAVAD
jgi:putative phosphoribosyl transferase